MRLAHLILCLALGAGLPARGSVPGTAPWVLCDAAARQAATETGVPFEVLAAITRTETGRGRDGVLRPWPWTVNMEGAGRWFDDPAAALDYARRHRARGAVSFDVGCFQINWRWHRAHFASLEEMFDPLAGARYAARFLSELHREFGTWPAAAGAYHSRTPKHATRYRKLFETHLASVRRAGDRLPNAAPARRTRPGSPVPAAPPAALRRVNAYPLLRAPSAQARRAPGSLVPLGG
ncbi:lytic transglycosylase domain-containing protein [Limimaricola sp. AA108-03]|uniref:lytic transglycosylase domain-containing protein n=1 Tax=Limimaricola sp. AA108-03 TaxID=3425945 RepID=UPI003D7764CE